MEIGNLMFGNSRGEYPVPRGQGYEGELHRLFNAYAPNRDNSWREYGEEFENETFFVFPFYWGDCTCGYELAEWAWSRAHKHAPTCYFTEYRALEKDSKKPWTVRTKDAKALCKKHGIPWDGGRGSAVHCDCPHDSEWAAWTAKNAHAHTCPIIRPNFCYKPQDFHLQWYKYPLRDSYSNQEMDLPAFRAIIDACIASLGGC